MTEENNIALIDLKNVILNILSMLMCHSGYAQVYNWKN